MMGPRARREKEKENMRNAILEAATKIILEEGYDKLTMRKIANLIEYTPTTIYLYYKDKAQIVDDILIEVQKRTILNAMTISEENKDVSIDKRLELIFKSFISTMVSNAEMGRAVIRSGTKAMFRESDGTEPPEENGLFMLHDLLLKGQQQSVFRKLDENVSWMLLSALLGFSINAIENQLYLKADWDKQVNVYVEILINGLLKEINDNERR